MKTLIATLTVLALAVPTALAAPPSGQGQGQQSLTPSASETCKQQRRTIGQQAFRDLYAPSGTPKAAMDACLTAQKSITGIAAKNAAMECKAERAADEAAFNAKYGKNENDKNAFGKCVSAKSTEAIVSTQEATLKAAKKCKAMRTSQRAAFDAAYGTKKNAFGKCVSKESKAQDD